MIKKFSLITLLAGFLVAASVTANAKTFKMALGDSQGGTQWALGQEFARLFAEKTGNEIKLFPNGQLGSEQDTVNEAAIGTLDFSVLAINNITPFSPEVGLLSLPYMMLSLEDAEKLTQGDIGEELVNKTIENAGVRIIAWTYSGFRVLSNSKKPVTTVEDLQGLIIRVPKNEIMIDTYNSWGVNPTPMAWSETFTALQQGVVDGQDTPYITINAMKFYEVQKYITNLRYLFLLEPLIVSESIFQDMDEATQQAVLEAGKEVTAFSAKYLAEQEGAIKENLVAQGMEISDPANNEEEFINLATTAVWPKFFDSIGGMEKLNAALAVIGRDPVQ